MEGFILTFGARRFYPYFINGNAAKFHCRTPIQRLCIGGKKLKGLILAF